MMIVAEFAVRPDTLTPDTLTKDRTVIEARPETFAVAQALSQSQLLHQAHPLTSQAFDAQGDAQPSDHGYDDYWQGPIEP